MDTAKHVINLLQKSHNKKQFFCGVEALDRYLIEQASQDERRYIAVTYVLTEIDSDLIIGYYTLSSNSIALNSIPEEMRKKIPKYPMVPATLLGRLAVDKKHHGKNLGALLLVNALKCSLEASRKIASVAVVVKAKDANAMEFYMKYKFIPFIEDKSQLFLPMSVIETIDF